MENQQQQPSTTLCRGGCGFYGAAATEGLCSKCYKDQIKRKQERISPTLPVPMASSSSSSSAVVNSSPPRSHDEAVAAGSSADKNMTCSQAALSTEEIAAKLESAVASAEATLSSSCSAASLESTPGASPIPEGGPPAKKVNRCLQCKKRVGLTGFPCRCGGLFCSEHRYDTAHSCNFDYKTMEREQIAKNNPVVVSDKIQRI